MKNIRILIMSLLLTLPMIASAQDKTFEFYYIAHDYSSKVESICSMLEYFEIFLERMLMCKRASGLLGLRFKMTANGSKIV